MAYCRCLHHRPDEPHYHSYARPLAWLELRCSSEGCEEQVIVWLNPEEINDYERGSRVFHDADFNAFRVDDRGIAAAHPVFVWPLQRYLQVLRKNRGKRALALKGLKP